MTLLLLCMLAFNSAGQSVVSNSFKLNGAIDADTGSMELTLIADSSFYPIGFKPGKAKISGHQFSFDGKIPYPVGVQLSHSSNRYYSAMFIIEPGNQSVSAHVDSINKNVHVENAVMREYYEVYKQAFTQTDKMYDRLTMLKDSLNGKFGIGKWPDNDKLAYSSLTKAAYAQSDKVLLSYIQSHPSSYIGLWKIVQLLHYGYEPIFDEMFAALSPSLKATQTGKVLGEKLKSKGAMMAVGKKAAIFKSVDRKGLLLPAEIYQKNKYTLVDFWYSNCAPCIGQFPDLKKVYNNYHSSGLEIIGISTDKLKAEKNWLYQIKRNELPWLQFWDKNGVEALAYNILRFPTNILIDNKGLIVAKDISPLELAEFLKSNLKQ